MEKKLQRIEQDKMIAGVAAGLGEHLNIDPVLIRVGFVLAALAGCSGILIYIVLWIALPVKPFIYPFDVGYKPMPVKNNGNGYVVLGAVLILLGVYFLLDNLDFIPYWWTISKLWPLAIIIPGIMILVQSMKKGPVYPPSDITWDKKQEDTSEKTDNNQTL